MSDLSDETLADKARIYQLRVDGNYETPKERFILALIAEVRTLRRDVAGQTRSAQSGWRNVETLRAEVAAAEGEVQRLREYIRNMAAVERETDDELERLRDKNRLWRENPMAVKYAALVDEITAIVAVLDAPSNGPMTDHEITERAAHKLVEVAPMVRALLHLLAPQVQDKPDGLRITTLGPSGGPGVLEIAHTTGWVSRPIWEGRTT